MKIKCNQFNSNTCNRNRCKYQSKTLCVIECVWIFLQTIHSDQTVMHMILILLQRALICNNRVWSTMLINQRLKWCYNNNLLALINEP